MLISLQSWQCFIIFHTQLQKASSWAFLFKRGNPSLDKIETSEKVKTFDIIEFNNSVCNKNTARRHY